MKIGNSEIEKLYIGEDEVDKLYLGTDLIYEKGSGPDYRTMPLTFEILSGGTIKYYCQYTSDKKTIQYQINDGEWTNITSSKTGTPINISTGDIVRFKGDGVSGNNSNTFSGSTCQFKVFGNIMSLKYSTGFETATTLSTNYEFDSLFKSCTGLTDALNLVLPATTLANYCYSYMFNGCTSLTTVPELPATTLANGCYSNMFMGCTSLTTVPSNYLPVTTLASSCYNQMFRNCTSLTKAPELPATTLVDGCYSNIFRGCTSLNYIKCLATDISASNCTSNWVNGVASTGTFVKDATMTSWPSGASGIPTGWTIQDNV